MEVLEQEQDLLPKQQPQIILSPCSSGRRSNDSNSPEFEFWNMMRNPNSFPDESNLLSADELFSDGVLLPLDRLHVSSSEPSGSDHQYQYPEPEFQNPITPYPDQPNDDVDHFKSAAGPTPPALTLSKRWRDIIIFNKKNDSKKVNGNVDGSDQKGNLGNVKESKKKKESKKNKNNGGGGTVANAAELNINIWPFSRSRSAGNGGARPRGAASAGCRKVSSAPCSRSNSGGESKTRKWPNSPGRVNGVHLGRTSPVWQVRRGGGGATAAASKTVVKKDGNGEARRKVASAGTGGKRVLSLNVPMCIGYRSHLSCRSDENSAVSVAVSAAGSGGGGGDVADEGVRGGSNMFGIRSFFTKKVY